MESPLRTCSTAVRDVPAALAGATGWVNSPPLTASDLRGCTVLVAFWTATSVPSRRLLPHLRAWARRYGQRGLLVVGVHAPEFDFERDEGTVRQAVADLGVDHPVALDAEGAIGRAFGTRVRPALHLVDARGRVRYRQDGDGDPARAERAVRGALAGVGAAVGQPAPVVDRDGDRTPEVHLGHDGARPLLRCTGPVLDVRRSYAGRAPLPLHEWSLAGDWTVRREAAVLNRAGGRIAVRCRARDVHLVAAPVVRQLPVRFRVTVDGGPPGAAHGSDVDRDGGGAVAAPGLHQLVHQPRRAVDRTVEITFLDAAVRAYAVRFD